MHAPLLAILLLEFAGAEVNDFMKFTYQSRDENAVFESFEYTACNPLVVNRRITLKRALVGDKEMRVWAEDSEDGTVGMVGTVHLRSQLIRRD